MPAMKAITVIKRDPHDGEVWRYTARLVRQQGSALRLEALFNREDMPFMGMMLKGGDRFVETYFTDRWYNLYAIHDREDDRLKGWYCNIGRPAVWESEAVLSYEDLALDLWVAPDGTQTVLDEEEFAALGLDPATKTHALAALEELKRLFSESKTPGLL